MKKNIKLTGQQIKFIINMISILLFAFSYLYIYTGYVEKTDAAYDEIEIKKKQIESMEEKLAMEDDIKQEIEEVERQMEDIIGGYPVKIAKADGYLFVEQMQENLGVIFTAIDVKEEVPFYKTILPIRNEDGTEVVTGEDAGEGGTKQEPAPTEAATTANKKSGSETQLDGIEAMTADTGAKAANKKDTETPTITGMATTILMNFTSTYEEFKDMVDYIANDTSNAIIDSASISVDSTTGKLTGSLVIKCFALAGTGKAYEPPRIENITVGTDNIFGIGSDTGVREQ